MNRLESLRGRGPLARIAPALALVPALALTTAASALGAPPQLAGETPRSAGVYHLSSGSWSRSRGLNLMGPDVIYRNDAGLQYYLPSSASQVTTDAGRIPGTTSEGNATTYLVDGFTFGYCSDDPAGVSASLAWLEAYAPCTRPTAAPAMSLQLPGLPGTASPGVLACWQVTIDLAGSTREFLLDADGGDSFFDDDTQRDSFGWSIQIVGGGNGSSGPLLAGDPALAPYGAGTKPTWGFGPPPGTGLGEQDSFWIDAQPSVGCTNLGGYPGSSFAGLELILYGKKEAGCLSQPSSTFEPNDSCSTPAYVSNGSTSGLFVSVSNEDWYAIQVDSTRSLRVLASFAHSVANLDLDIWQGLGCTTYLGGASSSSPSSNQELLEVQNTSVFDVWYMVRVFVNDTPAHPCNNYDLTIGCCEGDPIGNNFCMPVPNSTGFPARIYASGSTSVSQRDLCLQAEPVPIGTFGVFHAGLSQASVPFGDGVLCVGFPLMRIGPGLAADGGSTIICHDDDLGGTGSAHIAPGSTWHFQAMYRDPQGGAAGFNYTDGVSITFQ